MKKQRFKKSKKRIVLGFLALFVFAIAAVVLLEKLNIINKSNSKTTSDLPASEAQTTSDQPSAQSDFTRGDNRQDGNTLREGAGSVTIVDIPDNPDATVDKSNPIKSETGEITVYSPKANSPVKDRVDIYGESTLARVWYRVVDSSSGMISVGELEVHNGKFALSLKVDTGASEGRIDVFGTHADGNEYSNVAIPVRFN